jgi:hypothetical protein
MGENWQAEIEATNSIILPFTTASFRLRHDAVLSAASERRRFPV